MTSDQGGWPEGPPPPNSREERQEAELVQCWKRWRKERGTREAVPFCFALEVYLAFCRASGDRLMMPRLIERLLLAELEGPWRHLQREPP